MEKVCRNCGEKIRLAERRDGYDPEWEWVHDTGTGIGILGCAFTPVAEPEDTPS